VRIASTLVVLALVAVAAGCADDHPSPPPGTRTASPTPACQSGLVPADLRLPERAEVFINVLNATGVEGRERDVFVELGRRGFQMMSTTGGLNPYDGVALIRYGPRTVGAAWLLSGYFRGGARLEFDVDRAGDRLDLVLGTRFRDLATITEVNQALAALGRPTPPPGTCDPNRGS
jgi:hypothetical protein